MTSVEPSSSDSLQGASGRPRTRPSGRPNSNEPTVGGGPMVPEFGAWNKNPEQAEGYTDIFNQLLSDKKTPGRNSASTPHNPLYTPKKTKQSKVPKSGCMWTLFDNPRQNMTIPNEPQISYDVGPSQTTKPSPPAAKTREGSESKSVDEGGSMISAEAHQPKTGARDSVSQTSSFDGSTACPTRHTGTGNIGYKAIDKLKQLVADVVSYKKNIGELQTKIQVLMEEVAGVQSLLISGENDTEDEVQYWLEEADVILKEANGIVAAKKRLCSTCWDPASSWETGEMLREVEKILEERKGLNSVSYFCESPYCKELLSRENKLEEILEALMDIHINMIGIYGMVGVGKTVLAKELAERAQRNQLFDAIVMVQVSEPIDIKHIQDQIANEIGLHLSEADDEETRAHFLFNALEENIRERGQQNDTESIQQGKILVILDGIHCVIDLVKVGIRHGEEAKASCKAVLIARNIDVCKEMGAEKEFLVECLSLDESRILFQERLGDKVESTDITLEGYQYMENILLMRCGGLPLVIKSLASALRCMSWSNWDIIVEQMERHTLIEVHEVKEVLNPILGLCNNFIETGGKQKLFLLCCLIQKGMEFTLERLKRYGIGFGLFEDFSSAIDVHQVNSWVSELKSLSLLSESKEPQHFKMHDIVQDVAISVLAQGDLPVLLDAGTGWHTRETYENCIAISMMPDSNYKCLNGLKLHKLQVYLFKGTPSSSLPNNYFQGMENLKILDISRTTFVDFPLSIGKLKNLVTLHLEHCEIQCRVISTISNLSKLEVLSLRGSSIEALTEEIGNLSNLRLLDLTCCKNLRTFCVDAVAKLDRLRGLYLYDIWLDWSTDDIKKLKSLHLEELEIIIPKARRVSLNLLNLRSFMISCVGSLSDIQHKDFSSFSRVLLISGDVALQPQESGLRDLLPSTEFLLIDKVNGLPSGVGDLNRHGFLQLKDLHLRMCSGMKCILDTSKLSSIQGDAFPELENLTLTLLYGLTSICRWLPPYSFFPKLRELRVSGLSKLHPYVLPIQLAVKLRVLEVSNCRSLLYIFPISEINVTDSGLELPCMEKLILKELTGLLALQDVLEASIQFHRRLLFNEKMEFPLLKEMILWGLDYNENLWDFWGSKERDVELLHLHSQTWGKEPYGRSPSFGNLKCMQVHHCNKLESLFPFWVVNSLLQLEELRVFDCHNMKEIITSTDVEDDINPDITFPKLQILDLSTLHRLECFYQGRLPLKFPVLRTMILYGTGMMAFTLPRNPSVQMEDTILFDGECVFPSLQQLTVWWMNFELLERCSETTIFPNLSRLVLRNLPNLIALPIINSKSLRFLDLQKIEFLKVLFSIQPTYMPSTSLVMSWELEELMLREFDSLEKLVDDEKSAENSNQFDVKLLFSLRKVEMRSMRHLKRVPWNMLANLSSLIIYGVEGWTSVISTTLLRGGSVLPLLEYLEVGNCDSLEAVISEEVQDDGDFVKYGITLFPCLRHIDLYMLPLLQSFSLGSYEAQLPSLETVRISKCRLMHSFSLGPLKTPRLKSLILDSRSIQADTFDGLNAIVAELH